MADAMRPAPRPLLLADVLRVVLGPDVAPLGISEDLQVSGITHDSRSVRPGDLYLALPGRVTHGAHFAGDAARSGAVAIVTDDQGERECSSVGLPVIVVEDPRRLAGPLAAAVHAWPARSLQLLAVTGTNGKSTVTAMVESGLAAAGLRVGTIGTIGVRIDGTDHAGARTTPEATDLQALLAVMREAGVQSVMMEASSIAVREHRLDGFRFDVVGFTHLSQDHLDYHSDMEEYYAAKADLFTPEHAAIGVVGIDDEHGQRLHREARIPVYSWSLSSRAADWHAESLRPMPSGSAVQVVGPHGERALLHVPLPGTYNAANALCAFALLRTAGITADAAVRGIGSTVVPGRMQVVTALGQSTSHRGVTGVVDYAHSPDAIARAIEAVREHCAGRVIVVLGAGGDRDRSKRPLMGQEAARLADVLVITDDNPRGEDPSSIRAEILAGAAPIAAAGAVIDEGDRARAIARAVGMAQERDTVLVLGKGHEKGQEVAGVVTPFDDVSILRAALESGS